MSRPVPVRGLAKGVATAARGKGVAHGVPHDEKESHVSLALVVMAAGRGSRFGGMKQLAAVGPAGEALFDYSVYDARRAGFERAVFVVSEESRDAVVSHVQAGCGRHIDVAFAEQRVEGRDKPWGTGQAVLCACPHIDDSFGVVNADDFYGRRSFEALERELRAGGTEHVLVGFRLRDTLSPHGGVSRGKCVVEDGTLVSITELHDVLEADGALTCREGDELTGDELISANLWGFRPSFCQTLAEEFDRFREESASEPDAEFLIGNAVAAETSGSVRVVPTPERFLGITFREDLATVTDEIAALVEAGTYPPSLWE